MLSTKILSARFMSLLALSFALTVSAAFAQQSTGTLRGQITDQFGGVIIGATVTITDASGTTKTATTNEEGNYALSGLTPGTYTVRATSSGFALYENPEVEIANGRSEPLNIKLGVALEKQEVSVSAEAPLTTAPENNAGAVVLRGADLDALPDDADDLSAALQALAGPSAGPNGGQFFIDGFTDGRLPPKESIREIRINSNPFSAEYDRLGFGRVEIFTKPGSDKFRGQAFFNFKDESLNSRNPFAPTRAPFQEKRFGGNLSGPVVAKKASFFLDFERRATDDNAVINATILDPSLNITPFSQTVLTPDRRTTFSPRVDYQLNQNNTFVGRYTYARSSSINRGTGEFSLASRAFNSSNTEHTLQLTETAVINQTIVNETRFQFVRRRADQRGDNSIPTINVLEAFTGGGSQVGLSFNDEDRYEIQNYTSFTLGHHSLKAGARLRHVSIDDSSPNNFGGTFTFGGGLAPQLNASNQIVTDAAGQPVLVPITSLERYRRTLAFQRQGLSFDQIRTLGGGPTQFSIVSGNPLANVSQTDFSPFLQDDWRVRPNFTLSLGLRYEKQNNINSNLNFAPRLAFAYSPGAGGARRPKTVIRGGAGIFYERFGENLTLQANRFNGINEQQFVVRNPSFFFTGAAPSLQTLSGLTPSTQTNRQVSPTLQSPYTIQSAISVERQLPFKIVLTTSFINARSLHLLRSRNINAPLPGTIALNSQSGGVRPFGAIGNIYEYESSGFLNQNQLLVQVNNRLSKNITINANYTLGSAKSDTDGANSFPANTYDLGGEYGRSSFDVRHRLFLFGSFQMPYGISLNPFVVAFSGRPFNITTGRDTNGDNLFTERPAFASDLTKPGVVVTRFGAFDPNPSPTDTIIPRNFGRGPAYFSMNMRVSKTFGFGNVPGANKTDAARPQSGGDATGAQAGNERPRGGGGRGGRGGGGGRGGAGGGPGGGVFGAGGFGGFGGGGRVEKRYNMTFSLMAQNIFNNTNLGQPIGNLSSPFFGLSNSLAGGFGGFGGGGGGGGGNTAAGNRRVEAQIRFSF
ncbi:MAG: carboxypeptidase regulatory-like domain-containing protein [Pyrinomonadaceae bacterium]